MNREKKLPVSDVLAELNSVKFYQEKSQLVAGTYRVIEHDGEINYAVLNDFHGESWYSEEEYEHAVSENYRDAYLDQQLMFDPDDAEELMDSWDNAMISQEGERLADEISMADHDEFRRIDPHDLANDDDRVDNDHLIVEMAAPVKTLGDLLREHRANEARQHIEADDLTETEYENHKRELGTFNQRSSEQLDHAMEAKQ